MSTVPTCTFSERKRVKHRRRCDRQVLHGALKAALFQDGGQAFQSVRVKSALMG